MFVLPYSLALFLNLKIISMDTAKSIFKEETSITGLIELFRIEFGNVADILDNPSCYPCYLIESE
jgi:hypothetical protein